jgi:preprotein translocase subunit Sec63
MALGLLRLIALVFLISLIAYTIRRLIRQRKIIVREQSFDPYEILGVSRSASQAEIKEAYRQQLSKYHPDKVAHLGEELQSLARNKTAEIIKAYEKLSP